MFYKKRIEQLELEVLRDHDKYLINRVRDLENRPYEQRLDALEQRLDALEHIIKDTHFEDIVTLGLNTKVSNLEKENDKLKAIVAELVDYVYRDKS